MIVGQVDSDMEAWKSNQCNMLKCRGKHFFLQKYNPKLSIAIHKTCSVRVFDSMCFFQDVAGEIRSETMGDVQVKPVSLNLDHNLNLNHLVKKKLD